MAIGRGAIVNPDWLTRVRDGSPLRRRERGILSARADLATQDAWFAEHPADEYVAGRAVAAKGWT